ncbi:PLP-dependent aminotransferase family protein [Microbulbifer sp. CnH-101-G]|uniref:MocR-like pyridoxine biosynthesis transcription factor PdxR n=1 Tax=Microbulbifer sp. CnH-101-G TaxID=3243393 RepID=UPI0040395C26
MSSPDFADLTLDPRQPLQSQLYRNLVEWICSGRLTAGSKLPSSRRLSSTLNISRNTVTLVLEQLKAEGFVTSHVGQGVFVSNTLPAYVQKPQHQAWYSQDSDGTAPLPGLSALGRKLQTATAFKTDSGVSLPFSPGIPDLNAFPLAIWSRLYRRHKDRFPLLGYGHSQGHPPLRQALAEYLRSCRGVLCDQDQIIMTNGAQEALSLCAQVLLEPGDTATIENPGYRRARWVFQTCGAKLALAELQNGYLDVDALIKSQLHGKVLYTTPTHQYPMGGVMPASERLKLLDWASKTQCWILEDDYDSEFSFKHKPVAALQGMAEHTPVLYMGSFSKSLQPGLRLGYLVVPKPFVQAFARAKEMLSGHSPLLTQAVIADFIEEGHFVRHLRKMRLNYRDKWLHFGDLIREKLEPQAQLIASGAGMHVVLSTPNRDDVDLSRKLARHNFGSTPLSFFYPDNPLDTGLVLGFANTSKQQREDCIDILKGHLIS